jgi:hypothetical protein
VALLLVAALAAAGCFNPFVPKLAPTRGVSEPAPAPNTARGLLDLFAWCWNHRAYDEYTELFTEDFEFHFASADSAGNVFRDGALFRQDELDIARHLFIEGTATEPPAIKVSLTFDRVFVPQPDSRPGKTYPYHQEVKRNLVLTIDTEDQNFRITGAARFFVVRGDSAKIPDDLVQRGFRPDANRWYIERWEDETIEGAALTADLGAAGLSAVRSAMLRGGSQRLTAAASPYAGGAGNAATAWPNPTVTWGYIMALYHADR